MADNKTSMPRRRGMHGRGMGTPVEKAKDFKGTLRKLIAYVSKYHIAIILVALFTIGSTVFNIV